MRLRRKEEDQPEAKEERRESAHKKRRLGRGELLVVDLCATTRSVS